MKDSIAKVNIWLSGPGKEYVCELGASWDGMHKQGT